MEAILFLLAIIGGLSGLCAFGFYISLKDDIARKLFYAFAGSAALLLILFALPTERTVSKHKVYLKPVAADVYVAKPFGKTLVLSRSGNIDSDFKFEEILEVSQATLSQLAHNKDSQKILLTCYKIKRESKVLPLDYFDIYIIKVGTSPSLEQEIVVKELLDPKSKIEHKYVE